MAVMEQMEPKRYEFDLKSFSLSVQCRPDGLSYDAAYTCRTKDVVGFFICPIHHNLTICKCFCNYTHSPLEGALKGLTHLNI